MQSNPDQLSPSLFQFHGKPDMRQAVPLGLQHVVAAIVGVVTPAIIIASSCNLDTRQTTILVQVSLIFTALATLIQLFPIGRVGAGLPLIMGTSFAYVPALMVIGVEFGLPAILGAQIVGGLVAVLVGLFLKQLRVLLPPVVTGTVILAIGFSLYPTAVRYMAGGAQALADDTFGGGKHWIVAIVTLLVVIFCSNFTKGITKLASILIGIMVGYIVSIPFGMVNLDPVASAGWFHFIRPMEFEITFVPSACITMAVMFAVNAVQTIGDMTTTTIGGFDREPTTRELSGGIVAQGLASITGAMFGGLPTASFSQNVGIVAVNRVVNRTVFSLAAAIMLIAGFIPKIASALTTIPQAVIGGATISVFASIAMTGIRMITANGFTPRASTIVGISVALGIGVTSVAGSLRGFPDWIGQVFGSSAVVIATLAAIALNLILPKEKPVEK